VTLFNYEQKLEDLAAIDAKMAAPDFWDNRTRRRRSSRR
jgi:hypothetical protein